MGYLRCEACGAKALSAASTCPKCSAAFHLHDGRGQRVPLRKCSSCGIMHRRDRTCHWCGDAKPAAWRSPAVLRSATGMAALALVAISSWAIREPASEMLAQLLEPTPVLRTSALTEGPEAVISPTTTGSPLADAPGEATVATTTLPVSSTSADSVVAVESAGTIQSDTTTWEPAVARTWVNVRSDAGRGGDVVGIIKPAERAMLGGESRAGWRQIKSPDMSGWVDPRLFESDSLRTRG